MSNTGFKPLYSQVKDVLIDRIASGVWVPGEQIPSEFELADELEVSQGTVRRALNTLTRENLVVRRQGRGTFIPDLSEAGTLSGFADFMSPDGSHVNPEPVRQTVSRQPVTPALQRSFGPVNSDYLWLVERILLVAPATRILERIYVRPDLVPALDTSLSLPDNLCQHYQKAHGIMVVSVTDTIRAMAARRFQFRRTGVAIGTPLLELNRISSDQHGRVIDVRWLHFPTDTLSYETSATSARPRT